MTRPLPRSESTEVLLVRHQGGRAGSTRLDPTLSQIAPQRIVVAARIYFHISTCKARNLPRRRIRISPSRYPERESFHHLQHFASELHQRFTCLLHHKNSKPNKLHAPPPTKRMFSCFPSAKTYTPPQLTSSRSPANSTKAANRHPATPLRQATSKI